MAPRSFVLRVSAARTLPSRAAQQISLGKTQRTSIPHRHHYACGSAGKYRISPSGAGSSTAHALRRFTFVRRVTRTYGFYRTPPRGPTSVSLPSGQAVVPHSSALASSVLSSPCQGLRFGLSPPVRCSCQTHSSALRAPPLCRCAERTADLIQRSGWRAVYPTPPPPRGWATCRGEVKEEPAGRGARVAACGQSSRLANPGTPPPGIRPQVTPARPEPEP